MVSTAAILKCQKSVTPSCRNAMEMDPANQKKLIPLCAPENSPLRPYVIEVVRAFCVILAETIRPVCVMIDAEQIRELASRLQVVVSQAQIYETTCGKQLLTMRCDQRLF